MMTKNAKRKIPDWMSSYNDTLETKVRRSVCVLNDVCKTKEKDIPLIVNFSGGKDSTAMLILAKKVTDNVECAYVDGGMDIDGTADYVRDRCAALGVRLHVIDVKDVGADHRKNGPLDGAKVFADYVKRYKYFPSVGRRWCSTWLKQRPMKKYWRGIYGRNRVLYKMNGVRMYESSVRLWKYGNPKHFMKYVVNGNKFLRYDAEHPPCILVYPILEWKTEDVVRFIRESGQPLHEGYKKYGISGCKWCPVHTPDIYARILQERPSFYDDIIELEEYVGRPCVRGGIWLKDIKANPALYIPVDNNRISPV